SYLIPLMVYSYDYYRDMDKDKDTNQERAASFNRKSRIYPYIMGGYLSLLIILLLVFSNWMMILFILSLIMVGILYPLGLKNITQKVPAFKNMYTILIWAAAGTFSLAFFNSLQINLTYLLIFLFFYIKMLPNTIFFDLKDIISDKKEGLKTIPVLLGKEKTLKLLYRLNILAFIPLFIGIYLNIIPVFASVMLIFFFYSWYYLHKTSKTTDKEMKMNYYILADAEFIIWPVVLLLGKFLFSGI
ncbi:MAG TPA: UbiA family prenyltransferase, partial [Methanobacterium sp.]